MSDIFDAKIKNEELVNKFDISEYIDNSELEEKIKTLVTKAELKADQDKIVKLQTYNLFFL